MLKKSKEVRLISKIDSRAFNSVESSSVTSYFIYIYIFPVYILQREKEKEKVPL